MRDILNTKFDWSCGVIVEVLHHNETRQYITHTALELIFQCNLKDLYLVTLETRPTNNPPPGHVFGLQLGFFDYYAIIRLALFWLFRMRTVLY